MKKMNNFFTMSNTVKVVMQLVFVSFFVFGFTMDDKITICHIPPGNPDNCHEITISINSLESHLDHHGDTFYCENQEQYDAVSEMVGNRPIKVLKKF